MNHDRMFVNISDDVLRATDVLTQKGPVKQVRDDSDLFRWVRSHAYRDLISYINNTSIALRGYRLTCSFPVSEEIQKLCKMFDVLERPLIPTKHADTLTSMTPENKMASYRLWLRQMFHTVLNKLAETISPDKCNHIQELGEYLRRSFGNVTTPEFGPGNELMFLFFLCSLFRANILRGGDTVAAVLILFYRYIHLVRRLIAVYDLPMTSNPRCAIEDYFFVPYLWGAAQLCLKPPFSPPQCDQPKEIESYRQDYMMVNLIENLPRKNGPLSHHAFQLWCILSAPTWPDVYRGLERCYINHILSSIHTVENAIFWELMSFEMSPDGLLQRPAMGTRSLNVQAEDEEERESAWELQRKNIESVGPVRTYDGLNHFSGFMEQPKHESDDDESGDRLVMPHPTTEEVVLSGDLDDAKKKSDSSNLSDETKFFMTDYN